MAGPVMDRGMPLLTTYSYIHFEQLPQPPKKKTYSWSCRNISSGAELGQVHCYAPWRQYCYYPTTDTFYSAGCLRDIRDFLRQLQQARHEAVKIGTQKKSAP